MSGTQKLYNELGIKKLKNSEKIKIKTNLYIYGINFLSLAISILIGVFVYKTSIKMMPKYLSMVFAVIQGILIFIPITEIITKIIQNILSRCVKPKMLPKLDFSQGIPKEERTLIVIPSILKNEEDAKKILTKLEVYYLANKSKNIYCLALGDPTSSGREKEEFDDKIINSGLNEVNKLNEKYCKENEEPIFYFAYRKRKWNNQEKCYMGWERKRGILTELNEFLQNKKTQNSFLINTLEKENLDIKNIITLDSDTNLTLNSGIELIEAMAHPLNKPEIENEKIVSGYRYYSAKNRYKFR